MASPKGSKTPRVWGVVLALLLLTACGGTAQPAPKPQGSSSDAPKPAAQEAPKPKDLGTLKLSLGTAPPDPTSHYFYYAQEQGFYKAEGLNVEIMPLNGDQTALRALASGEVDVAWTGIVAALQANESGANLKTISCFAPNVDYLIVTKKEITRPKDIEGKKLAVSTPGAVSHQVPNLLIASDGGDTSKVQVVAVGGSQSRVQSLIAGSVDAAALNLLFEIRTRQYSQLHTIANARAALPDYLYACEVTKAGYIQSKKDQLQAFITGTMKGIKWALANPDGATAITQKVLPDQPKQDLDLGIHQYAKDKFWSATGELRKQALDYTAELAIKANLMKGPVKWEDVYVPDFVKVAATK